MRSDLTSSVFEQRAGIDFIGRDIAKMLVRSRERNEAAAHQAECDFCSGPERRLHMNIGIIFASNKIDVINNPHHT